jgi:hypothetical protein
VIERLESGVTIGLKIAGERLHMCRRMLSSAIRAIEIGGGWRCRSAEWPVIADIDPEPSGLGSPKPRRQHRDGRIVAMNLLGGENMPPDAVDDRLEQPGSLADPVA